eukprot:11818286-Alexandrium_andersonii.AAC.1
MVRCVGVATLARFTRQGYGDGPVAPATPEQSTWSKVGMRSAHARGTAMKSAHTHTHGDRVWTTQRGQRVQHARCICVPAGWAPNRMKRHVKQYGC